MSNFRLSMQKMTKTYGLVTVLKDVDFNVKPGEVHALVGENGAGKSTLLNLLSGVTGATAGKIFVDGKEIFISSPTKAREYGIAMIHQELQNVPELTVFQNMFLGRPNTIGGLFVNKKYEYQKAKEILASLDPTIDPKEKIKNLKVSQQQIVEIARALLEKAKIIAMDEPTSSLTPSEFVRLAELIKSLAKNNVSIIYVSHKMDELFSVCDKATILRDGRYIDCVDMKGQTEESIVTKMIGRKIEKVKHHSYATEECVLEVKNLSRDKAVRNASFRVHRGEVLGISGLVGAGRTELIRLIAGLDKHTSGEVFVKGKQIPLNSVKEAIAHGIGLVPENRKKEGILRSRPIKTNMAMPNMSRYSSLGIIRRMFLKKEALEIMKSLNLRPLNVDREIGTLSGGNQQKVIIGRWLASQTEIFLFDEPTRGIDVGAKSEIYEVIERIAGEGKVVIVISSEMPEIIRVSDRILIMRDGEIVATLSGDEINEDNIAKYSIGQQKQVV